MSSLEALAADLADAARAGGAHAGTAAVQAGTIMAESGLRTPGVAAGIVVANQGLRARIGASQRRGVYQEQSPGVAHVSTPALAQEMATVASAAGKQALQ